VNKRKIKKQTAMSDLQSAIHQLQIMQNKQHLLFKATAASVDGYTKGHTEVINYAIDRIEKHHNSVWKCLCNAIDRANQREKDLNRLIFGYVVLTIANIILMILH